MRYENPDFDTWNYASYAHDAGRNVRAGYALWQSASAPSTGWIRPAEIEEEPCVDPEDCEWPEGPHPHWCETYSVEFAADEDARNGPGRDPCERDDDVDTQAPVETEEEDERLAFLREGLH
jgi:hypothetical protein